MKKRIIIGTRGSELALWQAHFIGDLLLNAHSDLTVDYKTVKTKGDRILDKQLELIGGKGLFTKELENELLENKIDIAVHSLKDMPTELTEGLSLLGVTRRGAADDVLVSRNKNITFETLPQNAVIATGSLRRKAQLLYKRPDIRIADLRGNVNTRVRKFMESDWDAMVLAKAGLERLGMSNFITEELSFDIMLPAAGQGALGIEGRIGDTNSSDLIKTITDEDTQACISAERSFLKTLGGGCRTPVAAYCSVEENGNLILDGLAASQNGNILIREKLSGEYSHPELLGQMLADILIQKGAKEIINNL